MGDFCAHLPGYQQHHLVYVDRHESEWDESGQPIAENWMLAISYRLVSSDTELPDGCVEGLKELICHSTLPLCSPQGKGVTLCMHARTHTTTLKHRATIFSRRDSSAALHGPLHAGGAAAGVPQQRAEESEGGDGGEWLHLL